MLISAVYESADTSTVQYMADRDKFITQVTLFYWADSDCTSGSLCVSFVVVCCKLGQLKMCVTVCVLVLGLIGSFVRVCKRA